MIFFQDATIIGVAIHKVGNKSLDEGVSISENLLSISEDDRHYLMNFFCKPFFKINQVNQLYHPNGVELNTVNRIITAFFDDRNSLLDCSKGLARVLYDVTNHPKIKGGEFYSVHFSGVQFEGEVFEAVGLYKSVNKEMYANVFVGNDVVFCQFTQAINTNHIDLAALIIKINTSEGYTILVPEIKNTIESVYWKDEFLQIKPRNDSYQQTSNLLKVYKNFVNEKLDEVFELGNLAKINLLNKSMQYFKERETFDQEEFEQDVIGDEKAVSLFKDYIKRFEDEFEIALQDNFEISASAVKKLAGSYKSVIKLDKNFHIYTHGKRELIEQGFDESKGMNYYKLYYENEQ